MSAAGTGFHLGPRILQGDRPLGWQDRAACAQAKDPAIFFPDKGKPAEWARRICRQCPVRVQCAEYGAGEEFGVWGGLSEQERKALKATGGAAK